jgi:hypothetical protein
MSRRVLFFVCGALAALALIANRQTPVEAAPASADLDQCRNGSQTAPAVCTGSAWVNGNAGASNAHWNEGESIAYRMRFLNLATGTTDHFLTIEWDTTQGGKHSLDYLTTFNRTETDANPCTDSKGAVIPGCDGTFTEFLIPQDINTGLSANASAGRWNEKFRMYGGTIQEIMPANLPYTVSSGSYLPAGTGSSTGNSSTRITLRFHATRANPILVWGGHIATRADWGITESAIAINGSPYHMRLVELDGSGGNQDRSLSSDAAIFPATLTVIKDVRPGSGTGDATSEQVFTFNATSQTIADTNQKEIPVSFTLKDDPPPAQGPDPTPNTAVFNLFLFGTSNPKTVAETVPTGFDEFLICSEASGGLGSSTNSTPQTSTANGSATIIAEEGEMITCTFTNKIQSSTLVLVKNVTRDNGGNATASSFPIHVKQGTTDITSNGGSPFNVVDAQGNTATGSKTLTVPAGTYDISENSADLGFPSGYTNTSIVCTGGSTGTGNGTAVLAAGQSATCTVTNDDVAPSLTLVKVLGDKHGRTETEADFTLTADGGTAGKLEGVGPSKASGSSFKAGTYALSESTVAGWEAANSGNWSCVKNEQTLAAGKSITLIVGDIATCTITNNGIAQVNSAPTVQRVQLYDSVTVKNIRPLGATVYSVTFKLYYNADTNAAVSCTANDFVTSETVNLNLADAASGIAGLKDGTGATANAVSRTQAGRYIWTVFMASDANNAGVAEDCGEEVTLLTINNDAK